LERNELVVVLALMLVSMALGFGVYSIFFHPLTAEVRVRFKGGGKKTARWLKTHAKRIVLTIGLVVAGIILISLGVHHGPSILRGVGAFLSAAKSAVEPKLKARTQQPAEPSSSPVENAAPEGPRSESEAPQGAAPEATPPEVTQPEAPAVEPPAQQPAAAGVEPPAQQPAAAGGEPPAAPAGEPAAGESPEQQ
jgi:hypothetical protein